MQISDFLRYCAVFALSISAAVARPLPELSPQRVLEGDQFASQFGYGSAPAGDVNGDGFADAIIGAYQFGTSPPSGTAFIFYGGNQVIGPNPDATLTVDNPLARFGWSVDGAGDINGDGFSDVLIGAPFFDGLATNSGAAFVYLGGPAGPGLTADFVIDMGQADAEVGSGVTVAGDLNGDGYSDIAVGAPRFDADFPDAGAVFVYYGSETGIGSTPDLVVEGNASSIYLGYDLSGVGDTNGDGYDDLIVGAYGAQNAAGAVYLFYGGAAGIDPQQATVFDSPLVGGELGRHVAGPGDLNGDGFADIVGGAPAYSNGVSNEGAVFVFYGSPTGIDPAGAIVLESDRFDTKLGSGVADAVDLDGDGYADLVTGAEFYDDGELNEGAFYVWFGGRTPVGGEPDIIYQSDDRNSRFGSNVASLGDLDGDGDDELAIASRFFGADNSGETGAAFIFYGAAGIVATQPDQEFEGSSAFSYLGRGLNVRGDLDGDGYDDLLFGAYGQTGSQPYQGASYFIYGNSNHVANVPDGTLTSNTPSANLGYAADSGQDLNGDGYADVVIGAYGDPTYTYAGRVYIFGGGPSGIDADAPTVLESPTTDSEYGFSVAQVGDVDSDGFADLVIGAPAAGGVDGACHFYSGTGAGGFVSSGSPLTINAPGARFCNAIAGAGDVNGDGFSDVIVGAERFSSTGIETGAALLYLGGNEGLDPNPTRFETGGDYNYLGSAVAGNIDINNDGYDDLVFGASGYANGTGAAYTYLFTGAGLKRKGGVSPGDPLIGPVPGGGFGTSVSGAGDLNGDGYGDVLVGAPGGNGAVYVHLGSETGLEPTPAVIIEGTQADAGFGDSVAGGGDLNGDGFADFVLGARFHDGAETDAGKASVFYGGGSGRACLLSQLDDASTRVIPPGSKTDRSDGFKVRLESCSSRGRELASIEIEICAAGQTFGTGDCIVQRSPEWTDLGSDGRAPIDIAIGGLAEGTAYRWRARSLFLPLNSRLDSPPTPVPGRWRRPGAAARGVDIRTPTDAVFSDGFEEPTIALEAKPTRNSD